MIEKIVLDYLSGKLTVPVSMEIPSNPPKQYVVVQKTGSGRADHVDRATIAIRSYSDSLFNTAKLNEEVKEAMFGITEIVDVSSCELNSDYNATDTTNKKYRYQAVFDLVY